MHIVLCLDTADVERLTPAVTGSLRLEGAAITLLHVRDGDARDLMDLNRLRRAGPPISPRRSHDLDAAERARAESAIERARRALLMHNPRLELGVEIRSGRPEREIVDALSQLEADLVVLGARTGSQPGPHSIGHVARYVLDHAPCSTLIVRA